MGNTLVYLDMLSFVDVSAHQPVPRGILHRLAVQFGLSSRDKTVFAGKSKSSDVAAFLSELHQIVPTGKGWCCIACSDVSLTDDSGYDPVIPAFREATGFHGLVGHFCNIGLLPHPRTNEFLTDEEIERLIKLTDSESEWSDVIVISHDQGLLERAEDKRFRVISVAHQNFEAASHQLRQFIGETSSLPGSRFEP
ncbi:MAG: hypothetical protein KDI13_10835 [Alphaproteobacteria bacterium]|nr:hypothetical protein [Alphaproteobacteria bacterium]